MHFLIPLTSTQWGLALYFSSGIDLLKRWISISGQLPDPPSLCGAPIPSLSPVISFFHQSSYPFPFFFPPDLFSACFLFDPAHLILTFYPPSHSERLKFAWFFFFLHRLCFFILLSFVPISPFWNLRLSLTQCYGVLNYLCIWVDIASPITSNVVFWRINKCASIVCPLSHSQGGEENLTCFPET